MNRREFGRRLFAIGASFTAAGLLVRERAADTVVGLGLTRVRDRKLPPGTVMYADPKALRRLELHDDYIVYSNEYLDRRLTWTVGDRVVHETPDQFACRVALFPHSL